MTEVSGNASARQTVEQEKTVTVERNVEILAYATVEVGGNTVTLKVEVFDTDSGEQSVVGEFRFNPQGYVVFERYPNQNEDLVSTPSNISRITIVEKEDLRSAPHATPPANLGNLP